MQKNNTKIFYLGFLSSFALLTFDLYQPALPSITTYFNTTHALGQLTLSIFFFTFGLSQLIWGPLIDHYGRARFLTISFYLFFVATMICLLATRIETLIFARALQGFAVCCSNIVAFSSTRDIEDNTERARLLSHMSMVVAVSPIFAPLIGSIIFVNFSWQATFVFMIFIGISLFMLSKIYLKESPYWVKKNYNLSFKETVVIYREMLKHKQLWITSFIITFSYACVMIVVVNAAYLIIDNLAISPTRFAFLFACNGFMMIAGNFFGIHIRKYKSLKWNIRAGSSVMTLGSVLMLGLFYRHGLSLGTLAPVLLVTMGVSLTNPPTLSLALASYTHQAGAATAILNTIRMTLSSIIGSIVGFFVAYHASVIAVGLFICSFTCFLMSFKLKACTYKTPLL